MKGDIDAGRHLSYQEFVDHHSDLNTLLADSEIDRASVNPLVRISAGVYYKRSFLFVYGVLTTITLSLIIYDFSIRGDNLSRDHPPEPWFIGLDVACVLFLVLELVVRVIVRPGTLTEFWTNPKNALDLIVVILCILTLFPYAWIPQSQRLAIPTLILRYTAQFIRLIFFMIRLREQDKKIRVIEDTHIDLLALMDRGDSFYDTPHGRTLRMDSWSLSSLRMEDSGSKPNNGGALAGISNINPKQFVEDNEPKHTPSSTLCFPIDFAGKVRADSISVETNESVICIV